MKNWKHIFLNASSLPSALTFSMVAAILMSILVFTSLLGDNLLARLERKEQAESAIYAATVLYERDSVAFNNLLIHPFKTCDIEVREVKSMHGLYGRLSIDTELWGFSCINKNYITGVSGLPDNASGLYIPDNGTTLTIWDDSFFASELYIPKGYFRPYHIGHSELDQLTLYCSGHIMPELSNSAKELLLHSWQEDPDIVIMKGTETSLDTIVWARQIIIDSSFSGSMQAFARDSIIVCEGANLHYPSGVCIVSDLEESGIRIENNAIIEGYAAVLDKGTIEQSDGGIVRGLIYAPRKSYLHGVLTGCAFLGNPCCRDGYNGETEYTIAHLIQNKNDLFAYPEIFAVQGERNVIKQYER